MHLGDEKELLEQLAKDGGQLPTDPNPKKEGSQAPHPWQR